MHSLDHPLDFVRPGFARIGWLLASGLALFGAPRFPEIHIPAELESRESGLSWVR
jgi:hypothetical protein